MNIQSAHRLHEERLPEIEKSIDIISNGNADLRQEELFAAYQTLRIHPHGSKGFLLNKSQWEMISSIRKGKSVDNGFYKRKDLKIIHYEHLPLADGVFAEAVSSNGQEPVDEQAIFRVDLERFFDRLNSKEALYIRYKTMDGLPDVKIRERLRVTFPQLYEMKRNIRRQIGLAFAA